MSNPRQRPRTWGFRFSFTDAVTICVIMVAAGVLWRLDNPLWWIILIIGVHFFLFCNVFRFVRHRELTWAGLFVLNICLWTWSDHLAWYPVLLCQIPVTLGLTILEMRSPDYHGVFAKQFNPHLDEYLKNLP